ncbi:MAG: tyrosine-type recombinase/integrase [Neisseriaceae bacterium]|nr:MAG: tyrosine-type recombinase/integrase [Neisseriaceae bacterium]
MKINQFKEPLENFLQELKFNGMSIHTQNAYRRDLIELFRFIDLTKKSNLNEEIHKSNFTWALKRLSFQNKHPSTISRKVSVWRKYNRYLIENHLTDQDFLAGIKIPKIPSRLPKAMNAQDLNQLLDDDNIDDNRDPFLTKREQAMFELMYGSGLRVSEVESLNLDDIELDSGWVTVKGKGAKTRQIPLTDKSIDALKSYLELRPKIENQDALFVSRFGKRITNRRIQQNINEWAIRHQAKQHISPHMLRHSFATQILQNSQNIRAVQELLGHSQLSTTQIYTQLDFDHLTNIYEHAHPRAKKRGGDKK